MSVRKLSISVTPEIEETIKAGAARILVSSRSTTN
jgi:hypothetical protein